MVRPSSPPYFPQNPNEHVQLQHAHLRQHPHRPMPTMRPCRSPTALEPLNGKPASSSNRPSSHPLKQKDKQIGPLHDETGTLVPAKTLWSDTAYTQLLGRSPAIMARLAQPVDKVKPQEYKARMRLLGEIEDRVAWLRLTVVVGWRGDETGGGRLCVLGVRGD